MSFLIQVLCFPEEFEIQKLYEFSGMKKKTYGMS